MKLHGMPKGAVRRDVQGGAPFLLLLVGLGVAAYWANDESKARVRRAVAERDRDLRALARAMASAQKPGTDTLEKRAPSGPDQLAAAPARSPLVLPPIPRSQPAALATPSESNAPNTNAFRPTTIASTNHVPQANAYSLLGVR